MKELRDYQKEIGKQASEILKELKLVYISSEVRTGKTLMSLETAKLFGAKNVLFLTKKKAIQSIINDYNDFNYNQYFKLTVINDESMHTIKENDFDLIIHDENHRFSKFPKPSKTAIEYKKRFSHLHMIFLSGTPTPESYSQIYHQFWVSNYSPFKDYKNFYKWAIDYVDIIMKYLGYATVKDYSNGKKKQIDEITKKYFITYTQKEAGFTTEVNEHVLICPMSDYTYSLANRLKKDLVVQGKNETILADTGVKLMQKLHQIYSGTVKFDSGNSKVLDHSKSIFIHNKFFGKKIAIFYNFKEEYNSLKYVYGDRLTNDLNEFNTTDKCIALQIVSGREGISLAAAEYLVYYNIAFSALSYWQSRDRLTTMDRKTNDMYWVFSEGGIEHKIYQNVIKKKDFTLSNFKKEYNIKC